MMSFYAQLMLALMLTGCATKQAVTPPPVPAHILACKKKALVDVPPRDLNDKEVEDAWSDNRATAVEKDQCLGEMIAGAQASAKKRGGS